MIQKTTIFRFQDVLAPTLALTWVSKTGSKPTQNLTNSSTNLYEPTRRSQNGSEARKTSKNMPKSSKKVPTWPHHGTPILIQSMPKASPRRPFLGASQYSKMCHNRLHQSHLGCIMGSKGYQNWL